MNIRKSPIQIFGVYALLLAIALLTLFPLLWLISTALKSPTENLLETPPKLLPLQFLSIRLGHLWMGRAVV